MKPAATLLVGFLLLSPLLAIAASGGTTVAYGRSWPRSIVVDSPRGLVYVDGMSGIYPPTGFSFGIINASTHLLQKVLPLNVSAGEMAFDPASGDVYVAGADSVEVFDWKSQSFVREYGVGHPILDMAYDSGNARLYFTSGDRVYQVDPATGEILRDAAAGVDAEGIAINPSNRELFVAGYLSGTIAVLDASTLASLATISLPAPAYPSEIVLNAQNQVAYVATGSNRVDVIDARSNQWERSFTTAPLGSNATFAIALDEQANSVFALTEPGTTVTQFDGSTGAALGSFSLGSAAYELAVNQGTGELYVTVYHQVMVFNPVYPPRQGVGPFLPVLTVAAVALLVVWAVIALKRRPGRT